MKVCPKCGELKPSTEFSKESSAKDGLQSRCKLCVNKANKVWRQQNRSKHIEGSSSWRKRNPEYARNKNLISRYGITVNDYNLMLKTQNGQCAICGITECPTNKSFSVDHCHITGKVRGLLCSTCNRALGLLKDNKIVLKAALDYLDRS